MKRGAAWPGSVGDVLSLPPQRASTAPVDYRVRASLAKGLPAVAAAPVRHGHWHEETLVLGHEAHSESFATFPKEEK